MAITVGELIRLPDLGTWVEAGAGGLHREVSWAHVCELADPTEWLGAGDLLLTTGLPIPAEPAGQRRFVERLADAGLSGMAVGHQMHAPPMTAEMRAAADERALPLLSTAYPVPFTAVVRAVAEANRSEEHARLLATLRLYETVRHAAVSASGAELLARLAATVGCDLSVVDPARGVPIVPGAAGLEPAVAEALAEAHRRRAEPMPAVLRLEAGPGRTLAVTVPASRPAALVATPRGDAEPDLALLRHVAGVAALEVERVGTERERRRRLGAELLAGLIDGRLSAEAAAGGLAERGLAHEPRALGACRIADAHDDLHLRLDDRGVPHLLLRRPPLLLVLLPDREEALAGLVAELGAGHPLGLSDPLGRVARVPEAQREARWALDAARARRAPVVRYGDAAPSLFLPRVLGDAERAVRQVLGPLLDYDARHERAELVRTLRTFLARDRSWKETAAELHIHKQTLVYRMRRVEELTGRRLAETSTLADFWLALQAAEAAQLPGRTGVRTDGEDS